MPAASKSQKRFMALVKAVQKGDVAPGKVTSNVRDAANDMSASDVNDMLKKTKKKLPDEVKKKKVDELSPKTYKSVANKRWHQAANQYFGIDGERGAKHGNRSAEYDMERYKDKSDAAHAAWQKKTGSNTKLDPFSRDSVTYQKDESVNEGYGENSTEGPKGTTMESQNQGLNFYEVVGKYNEYGKMLKRENSLATLGQQLSDIAEYAEHTLTNEMDDWFDKHTVSRNVKEMKGYAKEFSKIALEADAYNQRMTALYDDMGRVLERYFDIVDKEKDEQGGMNSEPTADQTPAQNMPSNTNIMAQEDAIPQADGDTREKKCAHCGHALNQETNYCSHCDESKINDAMTERAVLLARRKLKGESLARFDTLPKSVRHEAAWRIVR